MVKQIKFSEYSYLCNRIAYWLLANNKKFNTRDIYGYFGRVSDYATLKKTVLKRGTNYQDDALISEFVECAVQDNTDLSFMPGYVTGSDGTKYYLDTMVDMIRRVSAFEVLNSRSPSTVNVNTENTTSKVTDAYLSQFISYFGNVTTIDEALAKIKGRGYKYYYNSVYSTLTTLKRIYNKQGVNCTDSSQLFYRLGLALGYDVQFVHVKCKSSGSGHIRLRFRKNGGAWFYRDPAAVLNGNSIVSNWCIDGQVVAYNPSWVLADV